MAEFILFSQGQDSSIIPPPQPIEHVIGVVCSAFNCTPDVALKQDMRLVGKVLEAQTLESAKHQHNSDASKMSEGQAALWMEAMEALNS